MANKKRRTLKNKNRLMDEEFKQSFKESLISALVATIATTFFTVVLALGNQYLLNKPLLKIMLHNESFIIDAVPPDSGERGIHRHAYEGVQIINNEKQQGDRPILISGNPSSPGYVTVAIRIINNGNLHVNITDFELNLLEFKSLDDYEYAAHRIEHTSNLDQLVVLYANLSPGISTTRAVRARIQENGSIIASTQPLSARIKPGSYKIYYAKIKLSEYGMYKIRPVLHYTHRNEKDTASSEDVINIIYDDLDYRKLEEKKALFDKTGYSRNDS